MSTATASLVSGHSLLVDLLLHKGILDTKKLEILREAQTKESLPVEQVLIKKGLASDREIAQAYSEYLSLPLFDLSIRDGKRTSTHIDPELGRLLPEKMCREQLIAPIGRINDILDVAFVTPNEMLIIDEVQLLTGLQVRPHIAPFGTVEGLLEILYGSGQSSSTFVGGSGEFEEADKEDEDAVEDQAGEILHLDQAPPPGRDGRVIRMVNQILEQSLRNGASDIHLEPFEDGCKIRFRIDGFLNEIAPPARALFLPIVSRFKILAKMDIAEKRIPQDGAIALRYGDKRIDLRVNTVPTVYGEKMVMRILDKGAIPLQLTGLGFDQRQSTDLIESIKAPHGLMLVTGPTGSGKSTTLYACLSLLNEPDTNICTVEDPVEYKFRGMNQVQVKTQVGLTFATALRSFLRQDPDIIMVGEVRDPETAQICLRAALTGHFVLSTIHTNDSLSAVSRLQDMGIEPFLLSSTLRVLEAQRLIRRLCKDCKSPYQCDVETAKRHGLDPARPLYKPKGCTSCRGTGYRGRIGIFEVIRITPKLASLIQNRSPLPAMRQSARDQGMKLLSESAIDKVREGMSSLEESLSVTMADEE
jgi:type IV pilus assembly protein PilB